ncbi:MAG: SMC-Scp complex subunit ScpB, partial [Oscillatoriales cyanobacterium SM2_2_1]|nr:SMC-Scp complex subunit ScpB [Oscillatoriales cyanobacterium SM2_2_1]
DLVQALVPVELGVGALRTLAAIALKGPIRQTDLVDLRGSGIYQHVPQLVESGFVRRRRSTDNRSYSLQVTEKFHQYFQLDQLPAIVEPDA